jgi:hypothetical protein
MTPAKLACPKCRRSVPEVYWRGVDTARCPACEAEFEQLRFPALTAVSRVTLAASTGEGEANCYFHASNRAEVPCAGCGRYICSVCTVKVSGQDFCPSCLEVRSDRRKLPENSRVLYDRIALLLALVPLIIWPLTLVTAPAAIFLCFYGWKKPGSIVGRWRRTAFVIAGLLATAQVIGWIFLFSYLWLKPAAAAVP